MITVVPTILARDIKEFDARVAALKPHFLKAHIDVLNDSLVEGMTFSDPKHVADIAGVMQFEVHLMVDVTQYDLSQWNIPCVEKLIIHAESSGAPSAMEQIRSWKKRAFIALNPDSESSLLEPHTTHAHGIMAMTVRPGRMGAPFQASVLDTIAALRKQYPDLELEADGGVSNETLQPLLDVGVTTLAVGSYLSGPDIETKLFDLIALIERFEAKGPSARRRRATQ